MEIASQTENYACLAEYLNCVYVMEIVILCGVCSDGGPRRTASPATSRVDGGHASDDGPAAGEEGHLLGHGSDV